jgi:hypothetical protein
VVARSREGITSTFLFRTGGDQTVRGYDFESMGVRSGDAVLGGRYLAIASAEYTHWFSPSWGLAAFIDGGDAWDTEEYDPVFGIGGGARWRTPIGPVRVDLAYGEEEKSWRLHFSVGFVMREVVCLAASLVQSRRHLALAPSGALGARLPRPPKRRRGTTLSCYRGGRAGGPRQPASSRPTDRSSFHVDISRQERKRVSEIAGSVPLPGARPGCASQVAGVRRLRDQRPARRVFRRRRAPRGAGVVLVCRRTRAH